jgi:hypothetical protein
MFPFPVASAAGIYPALEPNAFRAMCASRWGTGRATGARGETCPAGAGRAAAAASAGGATRGVRATGGFGMFFLNGAGNVVDSWLVGVGVFPPDTPGEG